MTWNYRIIEHKNFDGTSWFAIHEVHYNSQGKPEYCSEGPCSVHGEDTEALITDMQYMMQALKLPPLPYSYFINKEARPDV